MSRRRFVAGLGVALGAVGLGIHFADVITGTNAYEFWSQSDTVAHFASGVALAALLAAVIDRFDWHRRRAMTALLVAQTALALLWEVYEFLPESVGVTVGGVRFGGYGYHTRWGNYGYMNDTVADVALVVLGGFVVVQLLTRYTGRF